MKNWPITRNGQAVTATDSLAAIDISAGFPGVHGDDVMIDNPGPESVWVLAGYSSAVAASSTTSMRVPPGSLQPYRVSDATHLSVRAAAGKTQAVVVHRGDGQ